MSTKTKILEILEKKRSESISGQELADFIGVSRNSVWKAVNELKKEGYRIDAVSNKGYKLLKDNDIISKEGINNFLVEKNENIFVYNNLESTNKTAKEMALNGAEDKTIVIANCQTKGKGRMGREFYSPENSGIYMSIILKPEISNENSTLYTTAVSLAVCQAIEKKTKSKAKIKWVNDIIVNNKKVCGILTEATMDFETKNIDSIIIGIGINIATNNFPPELLSKAGNISNEPIFRNELIAEVLNQISDVFSNIEEKDFINEYRKRSVVIGKEVEIIPLNQKSYFAKVIDIDKKGGLVILHNGKEETLISGEISIKGDFYE